MPQNKKNILEKKVPFNSSLRKGVKINFERYCEENSLDKNSLLESLISTFLLEATKEEYDPTK